MAQMKMSMKISLGFILMIVLLLIVGIISVVFLTQATSGFNQYRHWARTSKLSADLRKNMLQSQLSVKDFIINGDETAVKAFYDEIEVAQANVDLAKEQINAVERAAIVDRIRKIVPNFISVFGEVVTDQETQDTLHGKMALLGVSLEQKLTGILVKSREEGDMTSAYFASLATRNLLLARMYVFRFLNEHRQEYLDRVYMELTDLSRNLTTLESNLRDADSRAVLVEFKAEQNQYTQNLDGMASVIFKRDSHVENELNVMGSEVTALTTELLLGFVTDQDALGPKLQKQNETAVRMAIIISIIAMVTGIALAFIITRSILKQLGEDPAVIQSIMEQIANGDMDVRIQQNNLGGVYKSVSEMVTSLNDVLGQVDESVDQVNAGAEQVAQASQSLSQGSTEQASSLEEVSASLNQINSQSNHNAENSIEASAVAKGALESAEKGNTQMASLVAVMERINESSDEIAKIVKVIDDIAFQINLLALNANVEAARAGKYGKGFAVVAEEVRNLAVRSAAAAKETTGMVDVTTRNIGEGNEAAQATSNQLKEIVTGFTKVADFLEEIALASKEQAQGVEQINQGLTQIDQVTQANTANAEESAAAAEQLSAQAQQLRALVSTFKLAGNSGSKAGQESRKATTKKHVASHHRPVEQAETTGKKPAKAQKTRPEDVIKLDDDDFGQF